MGMICLRKLWECDRSDPEFENFAGQLHSKYAPTTLSNRIVDVAAGTATSSRPNYLSRSLLASSPTSVAKTFLHETTCLVRREEE